MRSARPPGTQRQSKEWTRRLVSVRLILFSPVAGQHFLDRVDGLRGHPPIVLIRWGNESENELFSAMRKVSAHQPLTVTSDEADLVHLSEA